MIRNCTAAVVAFALLAVSSAAAQTTATPKDTATSIDTLYQTYDDGVFSLPMRVGLRIPSYDRVNGLSLPWGPHIAVPGGKIEIDPIVTYRSNLGDFDPSVTSVVRVTRADQIDLYAGRGTYTNDAWIRSDLLNSLAAIGVGSDSRNYYRGDKIRAQVSHRIPGSAWNTRLWAGASNERDWSTGIHSRLASAPWSFIGRTDTLKMRRRNPTVSGERITSGLAGITATYEQAEMKGALDVQGEYAHHGRQEPSVCIDLLSIDPAAYDACLEHRGTGQFKQLTVDARVTFPTFGTQSFAFRGHGVASSNSAPPQRNAYLGGAGTLGTVDLLALGGNRLAYVEGEYRVPLARPVLPFAGGPILSARYAAGAAGVERLPDFIQNVGVGIGLSLVKVEYTVDPNYKRTPYTHKSNFSISFSLTL